MKKLFKAVNWPVALPWIVAITPFVLLLIGALVRVDLAENGTKFYTVLGIGIQP